MQAKGSGRGVGTEYTARSCASGSRDTAEICSVRVHGVLERQAGTSVVPTIRKLGEAVLGTTPVGERLLCQYGWTG